MAGRATPSRGPSLVRNLGDGEHSGPGRTTPQRVRSGTASLGGQQSGTRASGQSPKIRLTTSGDGSGRPPPSPNPKLGGESLGQEELVGGAPNRAARHARADTDDRHNCGRVSPGHLSPKLTRTPSGEQDRSCGRPTGPRITSSRGSQGSPKSIRTRTASDASTSSANVTAYRTPKVGRAFSHDKGRGSDSPNKSSSTCCNTPMASPGGQSPTAEALPTPSFFVPSPPLVDLAIVVCAANVDRICDDSECLNIFVQLVGIDHDGAESVFGVTSTCHKADTSPTWSDPPVRIPSCSAIQFRLHDDTGAPRHYATATVSRGQLLDWAKASREHAEPADQALPLILVEGVGETSGTLTIAAETISSPNVESLGAHTSPTRDEAGGDTSQHLVRRQRLRTRLGTLTPARLAEINRVGVKDHLERLEELDHTLREAFQTLAKVTDSSDGQPVLEFDDMKELTDLLAKALMVDPKVFGDNQMFWRFDWSGDGLLNEEEGVEMIKFMMRRYRDSTMPPEPGQVRLGGCIPSRDPSEKYIVNKVIGRGGQGIVKVAKDRSTSQVVVIKVYEKGSKKAPIEHITKEFELLVGLGGHPKIARVYEIFQDWSNVYIVQEPYFGGDLTNAVDHAKEAGIRVDERWLAGVMLQVLQGVEFLHNHHVMHCDLKESNVMVTGNADWLTPQVVVVDFGLSNHFCTKSRPGGTPGYMPPEVWRHGLWTPRGDVFSIGVIIYSLCCGTSPFLMDVVDFSDFTRIRHATLHEEPKLTSNSAGLQDIASSMIEKSLQRRPTVQVCRKHGWFQNYSNDAIDVGAMDKLLTRQRQTDIHRALLSEVASKYNVAQLRELNTIFLKLDKNNDGGLTLEEVSQGLQGRWPLQDVEQLCDFWFGGDAEKIVKFDEFIGQLITATAAEENQFLQQLFKDVDTAGRGHLDISDIRQLLKRPAVQRVLSGRSPEELMALMDANGDGKISFEEFRNVMQGSQVEERCSDVHGISVDREDSESSVDRVEARQARQRLKFVAGMTVAYYSTLHASWVPTKVNAVDEARGQVQIDCKPDFWMRANDQRIRVF